MTRIAAAALVTVAGLTALVTHHKRPAPTSSATLAPVLDMPRASRGAARLPLPPVKAASEHGQGASRPHSVGRARPAGAAAHLSDVTMYCATGSRNAAGRWPHVGDVAVIDHTIRFGTRVLIAGNVYTVEDWIGSGSDFDIFGGDDPACERRALTFGRKHLRVAVAT